MSDAAFRRGLRALEQGEEVLDEELRARLIALLTRGGEDERRLLLMDVAKTMHGGGWDPSAEIYSGSCRGGGWARAGVSISLERPIPCSGCALCKANKAQLPGWRMSRLEILEVPQVPHLEVPFNTEPVIQ